MAGKADSDVDLSINIAPAPDSGNAAVNDDNADIQPIGFMNPKSGMKNNSGNGSDTVFPAVESKTTTKTKKKKKKVLESNSVPLFNQNGICCKCKSSNIRYESIACSVCKELFHAMCRDGRGNIMPTAIVTKTALDQVRPIIAKYGACSERWGNFMFVCNNCSCLLKKSNLVPKSKHTFESTCQTSAVNMADKCLQTDIPNYDLNESEITNSNDHNICTNTIEGGHHLVEDITSLLTKMKGEILRDVNSLMDSKLRSTSSASNEVSDSEGSFSLCDNTTYASKAVSTVKQNNDCSQKSSSHPKPSFNYNANKFNEPADYKDHVVVLSTTSNSLNTDHFEKVTEAIDEEFSNVPFNLIKSNPSNKKILLNFPSENDANTGKQLLQSCKLLSDNNYTIADAKKIFPKITVSNIPNYLVSSIVSKKTQKSPSELRENLKTFLKVKILEKNNFVKEQLANGKVFDIVFVNVGKDYTTLGVKVSPVIRNHLLDNNGLYVGNTRCPIFDRFHVKQCFKCQKIGHISTDCREEHPVCMYCSAMHITGTCPNKKTKEMYKCRNCAHSKDPAIKNSCDSHHSGSYQCPTIIREKKRMEERTDYSKNL